MILIVVQMKAYLDAMIIASTLCNIKIIREINDIRYRPLDIVTDQTINRANQNDFRYLYTLNKPQILHIDILSRHDTCVIIWQEYSTEKSTKRSCSLGFQIEVKCKKIYKTTTPYLERTYFLSGINDNFDFNLANLFQLEKAFIDLTDMLK